MADTPIRKPWLTLAFFDDGAVTSVTGPGKFPDEPIDINRTMGAVLVILFQVAQAGYERMLHRAHTQFSIQENLREVLRTTPPVSDKEM